MNLPTTPPRYAGWVGMYAPIKRGETGWRVFALQCVVPEIKQDGVFGSVTEMALKSRQKSLKLTADGIAGPKTQAALLRDKERAAHLDSGLSRLPIGVLTGFADAEGANLLAATNWSVSGGVDCGCVQWRISGPPFSQQKMRDAFDAVKSFLYAGDILLVRMDDFRRRRPSLSERRLLEVAVLAHNWPAGADQIIRNGTVTSPDSPATWAPKPGGGYYTRGEWAIEYPRRILKDVAV